MFKLMKLFVLCLAMFVLVAPAMAQGDGAAGAAASAGGFSMNLGAAFGAGLVIIGAAMGLVASYFNEEKRDFVKRFFPGKEKFLERATSEQSYYRIVDDLKNSNQEKIVSATTEKNILVLAGPGAGKTRVVAHRVAFLLRVKRLKSRAILVLCFNRSAVMSLRRRLRD